MKRNVMKVLLILMALSMLLCSVTACSQSGKDPKDTGTGTTTEKEDELTGAVKDSDLPKKDLSGKDFVIRYATKTTFVPDTLNITSAAAGKDIVSKAGYDRDAVLESMTGVTIRYKPSDTNPNEIYSTTKGSEIIALRTLNASGDIGEFSMICTGSSVTGTLLLEGISANLNLYDYIKPDRYYYLNNVTKSFRFNDVQFAAMGHYSTWSMGMAEAINVNCEILKSIYPDTDKEQELYDMVLDHTWTMDALLELGSDWASGNIDDDLTKDTYTLIVAKNRATSLFYGLGGLQITQNEQYIPESCITQTKNVDLLTYVREQVCGNQLVYVAPDDSEGKVYVYGKSLFVHSALNQAHGYTTNENIETKLLPIPMKEAGGEYITTTSGWCSNAAFIPAKVADSDTASYCYELFMALSYDYVYPEYFKKLFKLTYANDNVESQIFDICADTLTLNLIDVYGRISGGMSDPVRELLTDKSKEIGSGVKEREGQLNNMIQDLLDNYNN